MEPNPTRLLRLGLEVPLGLLGLGPSLGLAPEACSERIERPQARTQAPSTGSGQAGRGFPVTP